MSFNICPFEVFKTDVSRNRSYIDHVSSNLTFVLGQRVDSVFVLSLAAVPYVG